MGIPRMLCRGERNCNQRISFRLGTFLRASSIITDLVEMTRRMNSARKMNLEAQSDNVGALGTYAHQRTNYNQRFRDVTGLKRQCHFFHFSNNQLTAAMEGIGWTARTS